ncbi:hypothetical protein JCM8547_006249 [Rhodosporidiobolus lusitaniae]
MTEWDSSLLLALPLSKLGYKIHSHSGHRASFHPNHILSPSPASLSTSASSEATVTTDDSSRWTAPSPEDRRQQTKRQAQLGGQQAGTAGRRIESEWICLELDEVCVVREVGFGKTTRPHPCNLTSFTLFGGPTPDLISMELLIGDGTLRNDAKEERVRCAWEVSARGGEEDGASDEGNTERGKQGRAPIPVKYLHLQAHLASNPNYSISIWHLFLLGHSCTSLSSLSPLPPSFPTSRPSLLSLYEQHRKRQTTHAILAHLRRAGPAFEGAFKALWDASDEKTREGFENPLLASLHSQLTKGDWDGAEETLDAALAAGLFRLYSTSSSSRGTPVAKWERLLPPPPSWSSLPLDPPSPSSPSSPPSPTWPAGRGGHSLVRVGRKLLLFGGWTGSSDLDCRDVWEWELPYSVQTAQAGERGGPWRLVKARWEGKEEGRQGPGGRSCHAVAVDEEGGWVYLLGGRKDDPADFPPPPAAPPASSSAPNPSSASMDVEDGVVKEEEAEATKEEDDPWRSDFWRYKATGRPEERGVWECLSRDVRKEGGPGLLFDHSLAFHSATQRLFVFGGKNQPYEPEPDVDDVLAGTAALGASGKRDEGRYSGLWCYDVRMARWSHLFGDPPPSPSAPSPSALTYAHSSRLLSRAGHALLLDPHPKRPTLYVHSGQRHETYLQDLWAIRLASAEDARGRKRTRVGGGGGEGGEGGEEVSGSESEDEEEEDEESSLWRQGAVLNLPPLPSSTSTANPSAVSRSLVDLSALPETPEASPSRIPVLSSSSSTSPSGGPTILQIRRLWPPPSASSSSSSASTPSSDSPTPLLPPPGFTHRLTIDPSTREWTLLTGLVRKPNEPGVGEGLGGPGGVERGGIAGEGVMRGVWRRRGIGGGKASGGKKGWRWEKVEEEWGVASSPSVASFDGATGAENPSIPPGRYASQVVYDPLLKEHYIFGGHPGTSNSDQAGCEWRLDDFWRLKVVDPSPEEALRQAKFLIRKQRFTELCLTSPTVLALQYLQTSLSSVVDHSSPSESAAFRGCMSALLSAPPGHNIDVEMVDSFELEGGGEKEGAGKEGKYKERHGLWEEVIEFFPRSERQPEEDLEDTGRLVRVWKGGAGGSGGRF